MTTAAEFQAEIDRTAAAGGGEVVVPPGEHLLEAPLTLADRVRLRGYGPGISRLLYAAGDGRIIKAHGTATPPVPITAAVSAGAMSLVLASTTHLAPGAVLQIGDNTAPDPDAPTRTRGELVRVRDVVNSTTVRIWGSTRGAYRPAAGANARRVDMLTGVGVSDLSISAVDPLVRADALELLYCRDVTIRSLSVHDLGLVAVEVASCLDVAISDLTAWDLADNPANGNYGYGVNVGGYTEGFTLTGSHFARVRHAFTTNGFCRRIIVADSTATECTSTAWDTHGQGEDITFTGLQATDGAAGYTLRAPRTRMVDCAAYNLSDSAFYVARATGDDVSIVNPFVRDCLYGVAVGGGSDHVFVVNPDIDRTLRDGIFLWAPARLTVRGGRIANIGRAGAGHCGIRWQAQVTSSRHLIEGVEFVRTDPDSVYRTAVASTGAVTGHVVRPILRGGVATIVNPSSGLAQSGALVLP